MRKILLIGDTHAVPDELEDCEALVGLVRDVAIDNAVDEICWLGDQYHTFNVLRVEVLAFWRKAFFNMPVPTLALIGNHDYAGAGSVTHSMLAHEDQIMVISKPTLIGGILFMPYYDSNEKFVEDAKAGGGVTLVCHAAFDGSRYDNNFYCPDGIDYSQLPQEQIIVGHIHSPQAFGKVTYIGAPRWRTLSDANLERAIWVYTFDDQGHILNKEPFSTGDVCRQIRYIEDTPDKPFDESKLDPRHDWRIDVRGPAAYVDERKAKLTGPGVKIRTFKTEQSAPKLRESEGIDQAFRSYLGKFASRYGTSNEVLGQLAKERLGL